MTPQQLATATTTVVNYFNTYAASHPDSQPVLIDYLARALATWMDPRDLASLAKSLSTSSGSLHD